VNGVYWLSRFIGGIILRILLRVRTVGFQEVPQGPYVLVCNHISHFDPPLLVYAMPHKIDCMGMKELFSNTIIGWWMDATGVFPVNREIVDLGAVREALKRLKAGRIVVIFPESGIRTDDTSILSGVKGDLLPGAASLAHMSHTKVYPCLVLGADQLYDWRKWFKRAEIFISLGKPLEFDPSLSSPKARVAMTTAIGQSIRNLQQDLIDRGLISADLLPRSAQQRWIESKD
jgi:1-acyl-sn-glycerol-3-phosphate acyltransferase